MGGDQVGPPYPTEPVQARIPQGTGPFSLSIRSSGRQQTHQDGDRAVSPKRGCSFTTCRAVSHRYWPAAAAHQKRIWPIGWAPAFQAGQRSSILRIRSNSGVSEHLVPRIGRGNGWALCAGSMLWRSGRTGWACHPPRSGTAELEFAPVTEPVYVPVLETGFWEFDSPLGHQFHSVRLLVRSPVFQAGQTGSIPVRCTRQWRCACA